MNNFWTITFADFRVIDTHYTLDSAKRAARSLSAQHECVLYICDHTGQVIAGYSTGK